MVSSSGTSNTTPILIGTAAFSSLALNVLAYSLNSGETVPVAVLASALAIVPAISADGLRGCYRREQFAAAGGRTQTRYARDGVQKDGPRKCTPFFSIAASAALLYVIASNAPGLDLGANAGEIGHFFRGDVPETVELDPSQLVESIAPAHPEPGA